mmetsp:Transcript_24623/g.85641  ORF Transcript_24623/g.85641 Transcript_24623/m.85641 type:complete len:233 (+) Transcript_24623:705-1403(+)
MQAALADSARPHNVRLEERHVDAVGVVTRVDGGHDTAKVRHGNLTTVDVRGASGATRLHGELRRRRVADDLANEHVLSAPVPRCGVVDGAELAEVVVDLVHRAGVGVLAVDTRRGLRGSRHCHGVNGSVRLAQRLARLPVSVADPECLVGTGAAAGSVIAVVDPAKDATQSARDIKQACEAAVVVVVESSRVGVVVGDDEQRRPVLADRQRAVCSHSLVDGKRLAHVRSRAA